MLVDEDQRTGSGQATGEEGLERLEPAGLRVVGSIADRCEALRHRLPAIRTWICVDDATHERPEWAIAYEAAASSATGRTMPPWGRSPDDLYILYTGGTTGMPKGVMWRQDDMIGSQIGRAPV